MRNKMFIGVFLSLSFSLLANATPDTPPETPKPKLAKFWKCRLRFQAEGHGSQFLVLGNYEIKGSGKMICRELDLLRPSSEKREVVEVKTKAELKNLAEQIKDADAKLLEVHIPIVVKMGGDTYLGVGAGTVDIAGFSTQWSLIKQLDQVLGRFLAAEVFGSAGLGVGGFTAVRAAKNEGLSLQIGVHATSGFGFKYGISFLDLGMPESN